MIALICCVIVMSFCAFFVFFAMVGYPLMMLLVERIKKPRDIKKDGSYEPTVSYMIVAHNEEKSILKKLENLLTLDYPTNKMEVLVASDYCTDRTDEIVQDFILSHPDIRIILNKSKEHKGKTNAQNETQKYATGEILVMTDANSIFERNAIRELVSAFVSEDISYVCGRLIYSNEENNIANSESTYWKLDLTIRRIESNIQTITAGNGSIYAVRNRDYIDINPIRCHDGAFPYHFALLGKRALYNPDAISYEKAGEDNRDEFKRKVRMNRSILGTFVRMWRPMNIFKYKWFSIFYFGHRTCRYLIWLNHLGFFAASIVLVALGYYIVGSILLALQLIFIIIGLVSVKKSFKFKPLRLVGYYSLMVLAQFVAVYKQITGQSKPVWEKAESTR